MQNIAEYVIHQRLRSGARALLLGCLLVLCCLLVSCGNDIEKTKVFERKTLPESIITNAKIQRSERGRLQMLMNAPVIEQFGQPNARTVYPKGVYMRFFSGYKNPTGIVKARYAVQYTSRNLIVLRDSVVIIDLRHGDTVYLQDLNWSAAEHRIYSEHPLRTKNGRRVTYGDSFDSDDEFLQPVIVHQRGTFEWKEE